MTAPDWLTRACTLAAQQPQARDPGAGRTLLIDGDALAYTCGGADSAGQARINMLGAIAQAKRAAGADDHRVLVTARASHKGHRYAVARAKPYQGNRSSGRRPDQWESLRNLMETGQVPNTVITEDLEADDLFAIRAADEPDKYVINTQDKDMRMVPGWHLLWADQRMVWVPPGTFDLWFNDKLYGRKWFWLQMLMGDTADNVPGLPKMTKPDGKQALCGEVTALKLLAHCQNDADARKVVMGQYNAYYCTTTNLGAGLEAMLEQAVLLWMRRSNDLMDVCKPGGPLEGMPEQIQALIRARVENHATA